jgi:hypothetical protein
MGLRRIFKIGDFMISRITVPLDEKTLSCLVALAKLECRDPREEAAVIIRREMQAIGLLHGERQVSVPRQTLHVDPAPECQGTSPAKKDQE